MSSHLPFTFLLNYILCNHGTSKIIEKVISLISGLNCLYSIDREETVDINFGNIYLPQTYKCLCFILQNKCNTFANLQKTKHICLLK